MFRRRIPSKAEMMLWILGILAYVAFTGWGTMDTWPVARQRLEAIGPGPYIPLSYDSSSKTVGNEHDEDRREVYVVCSQIMRSTSTFAVRAHNSVVTVEELPFGLIEPVLLILAYIGAVAWRTYQVFFAVRPDG
jgi:hypothetical protein